MGVAASSRRSGERLISSGVRSSADRPGSGRAVEADSGVDVSSGVGDMVGLCQCTRAWSDTGRGCPKGRGVLIGVAVGVYSAPETGATGLSDEGPWPTECADEVLEDREDEFPDEGGLASESPDILGLSAGVSLVVASVATDESRADSDEVTSLKNDDVKLRDTGDAWS